jgi:hypothetical protein
MNGWAHFSRENIAKCEAEIIRLDTLVSSGSSALAGSSASQLPPQQAPKNQVSRLSPTSPHTQCCWWIRSRTRIGNAEPDSGA